MSEHRNIKVLHYPYWNTNPYHELLIKGLKNEGISCEYNTRKGYAEKLWHIVVSRADIIHIHSIDIIMLPNKYGGVFVGSIVGLGFFSILLFKKIFGAKIVYTAHNLESHELRHQRLFKISIKILLKITSSIIVHTNEAAAIIQTHHHIPITKIVHIPHGNYINYYPNTVSKQQARQKLGLKKNDFVFLSFGNIRAYKGLSNLVSSFKGLAETTSKLVIAGNPFSTDVARSLQHETYSDKRIRLMLSYIPDEEVQNYFNACDCIILPYVKILTSGVLILAASFGKPFIAPDLPYFSSSQFKGILYNHHNHINLRHVMMQAIVEKNHLAVMGEENRKIAGIYHSWDIVAKKTVTLYESCLAKKN